MSIIFGKRCGIGNLLSKETMLQIARATQQWAPDGTFVRVAGRLGMGFQPYHTHDRSRLETTPAADVIGNLLSLDGRLDNHRELRAMLGISNDDMADSEIMLTAFRRWGEQSFSRFIGDWAVALWFEATQSLYLARDHAGTRSLYFEQRHGEIRWATFLETLLSDGEPSPMDQFYATAFLSDRSTQDRTPYETIRAVPAAHFIVFGKDGAERRQRHWKPLPHYSVRYSGDSEYEEHFLALFKQSVARRTGAGAPILAHLSGGMDSSTIVCVSDLLRTSEGDSYPELLNTLSFYDDTEPNWNERPFFSAVEAQRGKIGLRVDLSMVRPTFQSPALNGGQCLPLPGADSGVLEQSERLEGQIAECGYRVLLSGIGGDELLGGIPTPLPELSDYLVTFDFRSLLHKGFEWCLALRKPLLGLLWETLTFSAAAYLQPVSSTVETPPWFTDSRRKMPWNPSKGPQNRPLHWRPSPSAIVTARTWNTLTETLPNSQLASGERREYRFPYLDRDLVDFLLRIPNEQLVRPGRRRSLMRRAVRGIVPDSVLERRRKGFVSRGPSVWLADAKDRIDRIMERSILARHGYVDRHAFVVCLQQAIAGTHPQWSSPLMRTCLFESWLQSGALVSMPTERLHRFRR